MASRMLSLTIFAHAAVIILGRILIHQKRVSLRKSVRKGGRFRLFSLGREIGSRFQPNSTTPARELVKTAWHELVRALVQE